MDVLQGVQYVPPFVIFLGGRSLLNQTVLATGCLGSKGITYEMIMIAVDESWPKWLSWQRPYT